MALSRSSSVVPSSTGIGVPVPVVVMLVSFLAMAQQYIVHGNLLARGQFCGRARDANVIIPGQRGKATVAGGRGNGIRERLNLQFPCPAAAPPVAARPAMPAAAGGRGR